MNADRGMQNGRVDERLGLTRNLDTVLPSARSHHAAASGHAAETAGLRICHRCKPAEHPLKCRNSRYSGA
jgi:hypothetical protein